MTDFALSLAAMDILREQLRIEAPAYPFEIPHNGVTWEQRVGIRTAVLDDLERRGLAHRGKPSTEVEDALTTMGKPDSAVAMVGIEGGSCARALVVSAGTRAYRVVQDGQVLRFDQPGGVVRGMVDLLPDEKAGQGRSVTFTADCETSDAATASTYLKRPRHRLGQLSVVGKLELTWFDTDVGRYISYAQNGWLTYAPADKNRISAMLQAAI
ncbi:ESX secretion-associated protein EspG [Kibdelosporangium persicum]|uniref:ESX secretion-associated protein EspG n=1 Tax=Kibdelosporangium persicum TaxID=2698649 RepID=A0ABX2F8Y7_9PSEU|nr:ESX secretion-associated protein EspG [Kibdelosporangium persicum]NRN67823.1 ESX secretion-associated protein EspG [Kibdelosporangium persicum]